MIGFLVAAAVVGFAMAWAIGAQDVSNALGTSVGSGALSVRQAVVIGAIFEFCGALMGGSVASTVSKGIIPPDRLADNDLFIYLMFCTLCGAFCWLAVATFYALPVSTTHSMVGSLLGLGLLFCPWDAINMGTLSRTISSWVTSPLIGFALSFSIFKAIHTSVLCARDPMARAKTMLPYFYGFTFGTLALFLTVRGPTFLQMSWLNALLSSVVVGAGCAWLKRTGMTASIAEQLMVLVHALETAAHAGTKVMDGATVPPLTPIPLGSVKAATEGEDVGIASGRDRLYSISPTHRTISDVEAVPSNTPPPSNIYNGTSGGGGGGGGGDLSSHPLVASTLPGSPLDRVEGEFIGLMVITATVVAFAHGSNDVSNCIGPFAAIMEVFLYGHAAAPENSGVPLWILLFGGLGIVVGLATYGHKCMQTVGSRITKLTFTRGFAAQLASALTVLGSTMCGISVSTTHCLVGAIAGVAFVDNPGSINLEVVKKIAVSWVVTLPASALFSIIVFVCVRWIAALAAAAGGGLPVAEPMESVD